MKILDIYKIDIDKCVHVQCSRNVHVQCSRNEGYYINLYINYFTA